MPCNPADTDDRSTPVGHGLVRIADVLDVHCCAYRTSNPPTVDSGLRDARPASSSRHSRVSLSWGWADIPVSDGDRLRLQSTDSATAVDSPAGGLRVMASARRTDLARRIANSASTLLTEDPPSRRPICQSQQIARTCAALCF
jgi:hypothetical protein